MGSISKITNNITFSSRNYEFRRRILTISRPILNFLRRSDRPLKSDAIFVFGSDRTCVADKAVELFNKRFAPLIVFTGGTGGRFSMGSTFSEAEYLKSHALKKGVPENCILIETASKDTEQNIRYGLEILKKHNVQLDCLILVGLPNQQLRQWATFERLKQDPSLGIENLELRNCPANYPLHRIKDLKILQEDIERLLGEVIRIINYGGTYIIQLDIPKKVKKAYLELKNAVLAEKYRELDEKGRKYPLNFTTRGWELDKTGKIKRDTQGKPIGEKIPYVCYVMGYPLPNQKITENLQDLSRQLAPFPFYLNPSETYHVTLMVFKQGETINNFKATPYNPRFLKFIRDQLQSGQPITVHLDRAILTPSGHIIISGLPQDIQIDIFRQKFTRTKPDIVHLTLSYPLAELSLKDHSLLLSILDEFNRQHASGLGSVTFDCINVLHQIREYFTEIQFMERIGLGAQADSYLNPYVPSQMKPLMTRAGFADARKFFQAVSAMFGLTEGNDQLRIELARDIVMKQLGNAEVEQKIIEEAPSYARAWTATGAHRYIPLALAISNLFRGRPVFDQKLIPELIDADPAFEYLTTVCPWFANAEGIPEEYIPHHDPGPILSLPQSQNGRYVWLDIGSAPKTGGAPTLNILRKAFSTLLADIEFDFYGTDIAFPYYEMTPAGPNFSAYVGPVSKDFKKKYFDAKNRVWYLNAVMPEFDITKGLTALPDGSVHFLSVCKVLHHLARGAWERLPFSSLPLYDPDGKLLREEIVVRNTRQHQNIVDIMLKKLAIGGLLIIEPHAYLYGNEIAWDYVNENNDDALFLIQRRSENKFVLYDKYPILYRPNADAFSPQSESRLIEGFPDHPLYFYRHLGIASVYPGRSNEFYVKIDDLFAQSNKLIYAHQNWKKTVWGSVTAAIKCIQDKKSLLEVFETYLRHVPDDNLIKIKILSEVKTLSFSNHLQT